MSAAKVAQLRPAPLLAPTLPQRIREFLDALDAHAASVAATMAAEKAQLKAAGTRGAAETELRGLIEPGASVCLKVSADEVVTITSPRTLRDPLTVTRARIVR